MRLQRIKREYEQYLREKPPRQFRIIVGHYDENVQRQILELARRLQPRLTESILGNVKYTPEEKELLEAVKRRLEEIYDQMDEEHRKELLAAALHVDKHGPPYTELGKHVLQIARRRGHIQG